jgi:ribonucleoside-triphosphate reductase (formate)
LAKDEEDFKARLKQMLDVGVNALEIKRKVIEQQSDAGLYPYSANYLRFVKERTGAYWDNHFSTIGIVGMNEAVLNLMNQDIASHEGRGFALRIMENLREWLLEIQKETGHFYNLEATPAEGTSYRLAMMDKAKYPEIITAGGATPYYTNSTQLSVRHTDDMFELLDLQEDLQAMYTGGTVQHMYLGEQIEDVGALKTLLKRIFTHYKLPYISFTPSFSVCDNHGYIKGEQELCPQCGAETEIWTRVTGYLRPVKNFNNGKKEEFKERKRMAFREEIHC